jgi:hypothetical protein
MNAPDLLDAMHIAWVSLLKQELISASNIEHAPLQLVAAVLQAAQSGSNDPHALANIALRHWIEMYSKPSVMTFEGSPTIH